LKRDKPGKEKVQLRQQVAENARQTKARRKPKNILKTTDPAVN